MNSKWAKAPFLSFNSKDEYIEQRTAWRREYRQLSDEIRATKTACKEKMRANEYAGGDQSALIRLRAKATEMIDVRHQQKVRAREQYEAQQHAQREAALVG